MYVAFVWKSILTEYSATQKVKLVHVVSHWHGDGYVIYYQG